MNTYYVAGIPFDGIDAISHHGIKGQKWGIRRYQNPDGTLTEEGRIKYGEGSGKNTVRRHLANQYKAYDKGRTRQLTKAAKARFKGKDPTKYVNRAKAFEQTAKMYKNMSKKYESLDVGSQKALNNRAKAVEFISFFIFGSPGFGLATVSNDSYLRKHLS